jgi:hypothetical protein
MGCPSSYFNSDGDQQATFFLRFVAMHKRLLHCSANGIFIETSGMSVGIFMHMRMWKFPLPPLLPLSQRLYEPSFDWKFVKLHDGRQLLEGLLWVLLRWNGWVSHICHRANRISFSDWHFLELEIRTVGMTFSIQHVIHGSKIRRFNQ